VDEIESIRPTHNPLSSPALSLDRLNIELHTGRNILISPKDKSGFLQALMTLDPRLQRSDRSLVRMPGAR
jgi:hypothetical protein